MRLLFDRGTLLVVDAPAGFDPARLPGVRWDPRVGRHRAPARAYGAILAALQQAGVRISDAVRFPDGPPVAAWSPVELRPYQEAAVAAWERAGRRGVVVLPTGSGKTRVALAVLARTRLAALCLVPTRVLLDQWRAAIGAVYRGPIGAHGDGSQQVEAVTVATCESAARHMARLGNRFDLVIVDEAHHLVRAEALELLAATARLGLTATPPEPGSAAAARVAELIGPRVYQISVGELVGTYLARFAVITLPVDLTDEERARYEAWIAPFHALHARFREATPAASYEEFARWATRRAEGRRALDGLRRARALCSLPTAKRAAVGEILDRHRDGRVLLFTADNQAAYAIAREHLVMPLTCDVGRREREATLAAFRAGELRALVSARVLNEGFDVPDADVGVVVGGTQGGREHVQRVGRLLRPRPGKHALVYQLVTRATVEVGQARRRQDDLAARVDPAL